MGVPKGHRFLNRKTKPITERFWARVERIPFHECWEWTASLTSNGYGGFEVGRRTTPAHRVAWELTYGPVPDGMKVCHSCDNPTCVRNDDVGVYVVDGVEYPRRGHLWLGPQRANMRDKVAKGRQAKGIKSGRHTMPWRTARGDRNGSRLHPESLKRGTGHHSSKLTESDITVIRAAMAAGESQTSLAITYGVDRKVIYQIKTGLTWRHVP